jgi:translation elongation factor EF-1alpha
MLWKVKQAGDNVGLLIRGLKRDEVQRGQVSLMWSSNRAVLDHIQTFILAPMDVSLIIWGVTHLRRNTLLAHCQWHYSTIWSCPVCSSRGERFVLWCDR